MKTALSGGLSGRPREQLLPSLPARPSPPRLRLPPLFRRTAPAPRPRARRRRPWYEEISVERLRLRELLVQPQPPRLRHEPAARLRLRRQHLQGGRRRDRPPEGGQQAGRGRVSAWTWKPARSIPRVSSSYGLLQGQDVDLQQAFVSWIAPVGSGLRLDAGKFVTHFGYEVIEGYDGWNDNATRSFLFGFTLPYAHTGLKATYTFSDQLAGMLEIVNGWDVARDNNTSQERRRPASPGRPSKAVTVAGNFMTGPERADVNSDPRDHVRRRGAVEALRPDGLHRRGRHRKREGRGAAGRDRLLVGRSPDTPASASATRSPSALGPSTSTTRTARGRARPRSWPR